MYVKTWVPNKEDIGQPRGYGGIELYMHIIIQNGL